MTHEVQTEAEMLKLGEELAATLHSGDIVLLSGELGAGKTTLTKGIAQGLRILEDITSPTFTLMNTYPVSAESDVKTLVHIDTYRLKNQEELLEIGVEDYLGKPTTLCIIEWPEKIEGLLKNKKTIAITIEHTKNHTRTLTIERA